MQQQSNKSYQWVMPARNRMIQEVNSERYLIESDYVGNEMEVLKAYRIHQSLNELMQTSARIARSTMPAKHYRTFWKTRIFAAAYGACNETTLLKFVSSNFNITNMHGYAFRTPNTD